MKLAFFDDFKLGVVAGDKVVDVTDVVKDIPRLEPQDVMRAVRRRGRSRRARSSRRCRSSATSAADRPKRRRQYVCRS